jgi:hypothetical protein
MIDYFGDKVCFSFTFNLEGIYAISIDYDPFTGGTGVRPAAQLYGPTGQLIDTTTGISGNGFVFMTHLTPSVTPYHLIVEDTGNDHFDQSSLYSISVNTVNANEIFENDTMAEATLLSDRGGYLFSVMLCP